MEITFEKIKIVVPLYFKGGSKLGKIKINNFIPNVEDCQDFQGLGLAVFKLQGVNLYS